MPVATSQKGENTEYDCQFVLLTSRRSLLRGQLWPPPPCPGSTSHDAWTAGSVTHVVVLPTSQEDEDMLGEACGSLSSSLRAEKHS